MAGAGKHIAERLRAYLAGSLPAPEREEEESHLAACAACRDERELLAEALALVQPLPPFEPRAGFAAMVALTARDGRRPFAEWLRWSLGGLALAGAAGLALAVAVPKQQHTDEAMLAQRLDFFEDMTVMQNQQALEDLDVVAELDKLVPEAHP
jgi:anti-sigma factor RsiW